MPFIWRHWSGCKIEVKHVSVIETECEIENSKVAKQIGLRQINIILFYIFCFKHKGTTCFKASSLVKDLKKVFNTEQQQKRLILHQTTKF